MSQIRYDIMMLRRIFYFFFCFAFYLGRREAFRYAFGPLVSGLGSNNE